MYKTTTTFDHIDSICNLIKLQTKNGRKSFLDTFKKICEIRYTHLQFINQPLVMITQIQRSGGTLLNQLFDGHPQIYSHPHELYIGHPDKMYWPQLDLKAAPTIWFDQLDSWRAIYSFLMGFQKSGTNTTQIYTYPFIFAPQLQKFIFRDCVARNKIRTQRDILNCFFTSYFNAWLDNQNLYGSSKKYIIAFVARMNMITDNINRYFRDYPDGILITIVRDPRTWFASAKNYDPEEYGDIQRATDLWIRSTQASIHAKQKYGDNCILLIFEDLVINTKSTVKKLIEKLKISTSDCLNTPTFNNIPTRPNSSYETKSTGITTGPVTERLKFLENHEKQYIELKCFPLYKTAHNYAL